jgi:predicted MPP superfamily phosphohydrolase
MLETGSNSRFETRMERVLCDVSTTVRIVYLSDLHFTKRSGDMALKLGEEVIRLKPDLILFGGDYIDAPAGLMHLDALLQHIKGESEVLAIAGNHDRFFGMERVRETMQQHGVRWIEGISVELVVKGTRIRIDGNEAIDEHFDPALRILCLHKPLNLKKLPVIYQLAFAGHLHGSQCVLWQNEKGLFPGRFFYKWNRLKALIGDCHYFISRGLGDTLPIRYNCPKELIVVDLEPMNNI